MPDVTFWFELASTYSYVSAMRLDHEARKRGLDVTWRPFLLGPIFQSQGWNTSPFKLYPAKGRNMWRDMERLCAAYDLPLSVPADLSGFPRHSVLAARIACLGLEEGWGKDFVKRTYRAEFGDGADIGDMQVMTSVLTDLALNAEDIITRSLTAENKHRLRENTQAAIRLGLYGAPSFTVGKELFWGNDRLEAALDWVLHP